jgi:hypothetical protein
MDRVATLIERLQEQLGRNASIDELLLTVQMMQSELQHLKASSGEKVFHQTVGIHIPVVEENIKDAEITKTENLEKIILTLNVDESEIEAELEQIRKSAEAKISSSIKNKPPLQFDPIEETPTLIHQRVNDDESKVENKSENQTPSLNDVLKNDNTEISDTLSEGPIKDLRKAVGINDRFLFINELFLGDEVMFERSIKTINSFTIYPEAEYWIRRELKLKLAWNENSDTVKQFNQLVKRRFNFT